MADKLRVSVFIDPVQEPALFAMMKSMRPFVRAEFIRSCLRERLEAKSTEVPAILPQQAGVQIMAEPVKPVVSNPWDALFESHVDVMGDDFK